MKAAVQTEYGSADVLRIAEVDRPMAGDDQVLIRVHAAALNFADALLVRGEPYLLRAMGYGLRRPKRQVRGMDVAGTVEAVGRNVTRLQPGDAVFGWCQGALAEYTCAEQTGLLPKPDNLTFAQAAAVPMAGLTALHGLRDHGRVQPGQTVLVNGASGGVGTFAVQIAKALGAEVTGVCSTGNVELVRSIGADHVVDYTREVFIHSGQRYDVILDNVGNHPLPALRRALTPTGTLLPNGGSGGRWFASLGRVIGARLWSPFVRQRLRPYLSTGKQADLAALTRLLESGSVTPVVGRTYPLDEASAALAEVETGHARGKVVVTV